MMIEGRVRINRTRVASPGDKADPDVDLIEVDGKPVGTSEAKHYILLNKPKGALSAANDDSGRAIVTDFLSRKIKARLYPVGRLDYDAEGAILITNDGELSKRLTHPSHGIKKKYLVKVKGHTNEKAIEKLRNGIFLPGGGGKTAPARVHFVRKTKENCWIEITVTEGRNRLIKRMCQAVGHPVAKLKREEFAGINVKGLAPGETRPLESVEIKKLKKLTGLD